MPNLRHRKYETIETNEDYYSHLLKKRNVKNIEHYATPILSNPYVSDRANTQTIPHIWSYGNRLYNLAYQYYGDQRYWWVIAWWNGYAIEAEIPLGTLLQIPINIEEALTALGV